MAFLRRIVFWGGSLRIAVFLMTFLALVCGWATFVELDFGTPAASFLIYRNPAFHFTIFLLALNILFSLLSRLPWRRHHIPFICAHFGILILLAGCWTTMKFAQEARMTITEGESVSSAVVSNSREFVLETVSPENKGVTESFTIPFFGGPFNLSDRSSSGWLADVVQPIEESAPPRTGFFAYLSKLVFKCHNQLVGAVLRNCKRPEIGTVPYELSGKISLEIVDYMVHGDLKTADPLRLSLIRTDPVSGEKKVLPVFFDFSHLQKTEENRIVSQQGVRLVLDDGTRVVFMMPGSCREAESLLSLTPHSDEKNEDSEISESSLELAFFSCGKVFRIPPSVLKEYVPDYADPENADKISSAADFDLGNGWCITNIEIVPTLVPGLESLQGWTARVALRQNSTGAEDHLQLSSEWRERDLQGDVSGVIGALFGTYSERMEKKILGRSWDKNLFLPRLELIQSPDGLLRYRYWDGKTNYSSGTFSNNGNNELSLSGNTLLTLESFTPQTELGVSLVSTPFQKDEANEFYGKVCLHARLKSASGKESNETFWLRAVPSGMTGIDESVFTKRIFDADGTLYTLRLTDRRIKPGFALHLKNFKPVYEPGSSVPSSFASLVDYIPEGEGEKLKKRESVKISMNHPGIFYSPNSHIRVWAYQDSFRGPFYPGNPIFDGAVAGRLLPGETVPREQIYQSVLSLNADPGRGLKYAGSFFIVLGIAILILAKRSYAKLGEKRLGLLFAAFLLFPAICMADEASDPPAVLEKSYNFDWSDWRLLPVFDSGRLMPLNSYAAITVKEICGTDHPVIEVSPELLSQLDHGSFPSLLPLDAFLAGRKTTASQRKQLEKAYTEIKERKAAAQKRAAKRIRELIPRGRKKFPAYEIFFSWIIEPDVWEYIPFITDRNRIVQSLVVSGGITSHSQYLSPAELRGSLPYAERIDALIAGDRKDYPNWDSAAADGRIDRASAEAEGRLSRFDALVFYPARERTAQAENELHGLLYPSHTSSFGAEELSLLEELNQAVTELKRMNLDTAVKGDTSPLANPDFYLSQTASIQSGGGKTYEILKVIRDIHRIAGNWRTEAFLQNERELVDIYEKLLEADQKFLVWRDMLFTEHKTSPDYCETVLKTSRLLGVVLNRIEKTIPGIWTGEWRTVTGVSDKKRIVLSLGGGYQASPAALFSMKEGGTLALLPNRSIRRSENSESRSIVWLPLQSLLWGSEPFRRNYLGLKIDSAGSDAEKADLDTSSLSLLEALEKKAASAIGKNDRLVNSFLNAAEAYRSGTPESPERFRKAMGEFSAELRRLGDLEGLPADTVPYPESRALRAEYNYFRLNPFFGLWFFSFAALLFLLASFLGRSAVPKLFFMTGVGFLILAGGITAVGGGLRAYITGWAPVTNMFETVVLLAFLVLVVTLCYAFQPWFGSTVNWCWNRSRFSLQDFHSTSSRLFWTVRGLMTIPTLWGTVWICYREQASGVGIWHAFAESFASQGILDRAAVLATMGFIVWFFPRFLIAIAVFPFAPRKAPEERSTVFPAVLNRRVFITVGALAAFGIGLMAYYNTSEFNPNIKPLTAVLRSNFWLTVHVLAIMFSYALGTLAWIISLVILAGCLGGKYEVAENGCLEPSICRRYEPVVLTLFRYAVLFLALGIILGARWADFSWGRFWSWDPKEVWALVTLFIYLTVLHLRLTRRRHGIGLALGGLLGGLSILMTWYGLSFVFGGGGRHSYAAGESGKTMILYLLAAANLLYGLAAWIGYFLRSRQRKI